MSPGDVVVCIKTPDKGNGPRPYPHPVRGGYYRVQAMKPSPNGRWIMLKLREAHPTAGWNAKCFRKVEAGEDLFGLTTMREREKEDA